MGVEALPGGGYWYDKKTKDGPRRPSYRGRLMIRFGMRQFAQLSFAAVKALVPAALLLAGPMALQAGAQDSQAPAAAGAAGVTFYTGANLTGSSKTLTLGPDQPYTSIPYVGDELNEQINSLAADAQIGAILFQRPYFASRDDACGPNLGTAGDPDSVWLGLTADFAPPPNVVQGAGDGTYEAPTLPDGDYSSVIAYRRDMGPPPGFLLLERRSYYNRDCERSADQSYFNRIFVPVPNPPQREACTDLSVPANAHGAGADAPRFVRVTEAVALQPYHFSRSYQGIEHRFLLTLFAGPGCSGETISLPSSENGRSGAYRLSDYEFDRKVKSVAIRYLRGPLDRYLADAPADAQAGLTAPAPTAPAASSTPGTIAVPTPQPAPPPSPATSGTAQQQQLTAPPASGTQASGAQTSGAQASGGGLQPAPPTAPPQQQQQALQPIPVPVPQAAPVPSRPTGPQEETFRFPVHQSYRLNYCLEDEQGCGEPAATAWCEASGFARATRWAQEDNIGALYPTVFIGSGSICDKFLCDGFEEITCSQ